MRTALTYCLALALTLSLPCGAVSAQAHADERMLARFDLAQAPGEVRTTLAQVLDTLSSTEGVELAIDPEDDERRLRRLREQVIAALATEGYFSPKVNAAPNPDPDENAARYLMKIELGPRATIAELNIVVRGALQDDPSRRDALLAQWALPVGAAFRDGDWNRAKARLLTLVQDKDYAAAQLVSASAQVDASNARVVLNIELDSGPAFLFGALEVSGLAHYDRDLVERFTPPVPGSRYDAAQLIEFARRLQSSPYFATAVLSVDPNPDQADALSIGLELTEARRKRVQFGLGYSTNTGPRAEATYRQTQVFGYPYTLHTGIGVDRTRSIVYSDLLLPPKPNGALDSLGVLFERTDIENVLTHRWGTGAARTQLRESNGASIETKATLNLQRELRRFTDAPNTPSETNDVLSSTWTWTRRAVDEITDPRRGTVMSVTLAGGVGRELAQSLADNTFTRAYGRLTLYLPVPGLDSKSNGLVVRGELGRVFTDDPTFVPSEFLFRTGGAGSVRGYAYQSIGRPPGSTRAGSTTLAVVSAEGVHWFSPQWGGAIFFDMGDAADNFDQMRKPARATGLGARWKTLAGPIALDLAWGERRTDGSGGRWRLHFSVAIAF